MMASLRVEYDQVAPTYHQRYTKSTLPGVAQALQGLAAESRFGRILEVGCGTGYWLEMLRPTAELALGLDFSMGMLQEAASRLGRGHLVRGRAEHLPYRAASFDLVYCLNALHHFERPEGFVAEARRLLKPGGILACCGLNPHEPGTHWYLYDYFEGTLAIDLARFPTPAMLIGWLAMAGFTRLETYVAERVVTEYRGRAVLDDPFISRFGTSELVLLSDAAYAAGLARIQAAIAAAEAAGDVALFRENLALTMVVGRS